MTNPTFEERTAQMREKAMELKAIAEFVLSEAQHMEASQARYAARKSSYPRTKTTSR